MPYSARGLSLSGYGTAPNSTSYTTYTGNPMAAGSFPNRDTALSLPQFGSYAQSLGYTPFPSDTGAGSTSSAAPARAKAQMPSWWNSASPLANTATGFYKPPNQSNLNQYLQNLYAGWSVNPSTGQAASPAQSIGKAGSSLKDYIAHKGVLDPAAAQSAIQQFQQGLSGGSIVPGSTPGTYVNPNWATSGGYYSMLPGGAAPPGPQTTNYFNPAFSQPGQMTSATVPSAGLGDIESDPGAGQNLRSILPNQSFDTYAALRNYVDPSGGHFDALGNWRAGAPPVTSTSKPVDPATAAWLKSLNKK